MPPTGRGHGMRAGRYLAIHRRVPRPRILINKNFLAKVRGFPFFASCMVSDGDRSMIGGQWT